MGALSLHEEGPDGSVLIGNSKNLVLLAWLTAAPGRRASRDYLSSLLWPTAERKARLSSLRQCIYSLSRDGAGSCLETTDESVVLRPEELRTDIDDFRSALERRDYEGAIGIAGGHFLEGARKGMGHELSHWIDAENERIRIGLTLAYTEAVRQRLTHEDPERAVELAREYVRREPLGEHPQVTLVQALRVAGNDPAALAAYEAYRSLLQDAVGDRPSAELEASVSRVREELLRTPSYSIPSLLSQAPAPEPRASRPGWIALFTAAVVAALAIGWAAQSALRQPRVDSWFSGLSVRLPVVGQAADSIVWLAVEHGRVRLGPPVDPAERVSNESVPSPDGLYVAEPFEVPSGFDLRLVDRRTGDSRVLLATPADEKALDWSPDGRYLAFGWGLWAGNDGKYWHAIGVYDIRADSIVFLRESGKEGGRTVASWSPDGTRIAYMAGPDNAREIVVMDADGGHRQAATEGGHVATGLQWSPDSRRLLFVSKRHGVSDLYTVRSDGSALTRLTDMGDVADAYAWVTSNAALFFRGPFSAAQPWAINPASSDARPLEAPPGETYDVLSRFWSRFEQPAWIDAVRIGDLGSGLAVGERMHPTLEGWTAGGDPVTVDHSAVRWSVSDSAVARLEGDTLVALSSGSAQLIGSAGGWRADTIDVSVAEVVRTDLAPVFDEDWSAGLDTATWIPIGDPLPYASATGGPDSAGVFVNNGDRNFLSGAFTRRAFSLQNGLTVEVWGRMPFDGNHFQTYSIRILDPVDARRSQAAAEDWVVDALEALGASLEFNGYSRISQLRGPDRLVPLRWPEPSDEWRVYTLQIEPDGTASVRYGDDLAARILGFVRVRPTDSVLVAIAGNTWNTRVEHGRLRVYEGLRYRFR